jgi:glutathione synthase/RimK-type ligase-like ATP-grasp enzyme
MEPVIAVYVYNASDESAPSFNNEYYALAYADLFRFIIKKGGQPIVVYEAERNYNGNGEFSRWWTVESDGEKISYKLSDGTIKADVLYDKYRFSFDDLVKINPAEIMDICNDKYLSYLFAPDIHANSFLVNDKKQMDVLGLSHSNVKIAIKELDGCGGGRVFVGEARDYDDSLNFPLLVQEFIDTSGGANGLADGVHDVRVAIFNGEVIHGRLRWPMKKGELRSNFSLGGNVRSLFVKEIPSELIEKAKELDKRFGVTAPRFFSADFGYDGKNWKLFELNSASGVVHASEDGEAANEFLELLAEKLIESAKN